MTGSKHVTAVCPVVGADQAVSLVESGECGVDSFNDLVVMSLEAIIQAAERKRIDEAYAAMAGDEAHESEVIRIEREFEAVEWWAPPESGVEEQSPCLHEAKYTCCNPTAR